MPATPQDLFEGRTKLTPTELSERFDAYHDALNKSDAAKRSVTPDEWMAFKSTPGATLDLSTPPPRTGMEVLTKALGSAELVKSMSPDALASVTAALAGVEHPDLQKDFTLTSPVSTGLVMYDLEAPAKMLTPKPTPLRNQLPRRRGVGVNHQYKRITGFTGTGTGGVGVIRAGITDATQTNFAPSGAGQSLYYARGPKISYAGDSATVPYIQFGVSDQVPWSAQFAGQGFQDIRALSKNALIWSSMLIEERMLLYGRGTAAGFSGVLAAPTGVAGLSRSPVGSEVAVTGFTTSLWVRVVAEMGDFGVSQATAVSSAIAIAASQVTDITYTLPAGATGARVFVATGAADPGDASRWLYVGAGSATTPTPGGRSGYNTLTLQGPLPTSGTVPTAYPTTSGTTVNLTSADGGSAVATEYDGLLAYATGANTGYTTKLNAAFSTTNPGTEYQTAFAAMWDAVKADPDRIWMSGSDRKQLSDSVKGSANSNYTIRLAQDDIGGFTLGTVATTITNETSGGKDLAIMVHPWLPQGNSIIMSDTLPIPDTNVDSVLAVYNVQDLMGVDWPVNQFAYECSSYWFGTLVCYAPAWLGSVVGIKRVCPSAPLAVRALDGQGPGP